VYTKQAENFYRAITKKMYIIILINSFNIIVNYKISQAVPYLANFNNELMRIGSLSGYPHLCDLKVNARSWARQISCRSNSDAKGTLPAASRFFFSLLIIWHTTMNQSDCACCNLHSSPCCEQFFGGILGIISMGLIKNHRHAGTVKLFRLTNKFTASSARRPNAFVKKNVPDQCAVGIRLTNKLIKPPNLEEKRSGRAHFI